MEILQRKYIIDENNKKVAVQLDIETFNKIEDIMENYSLYHLMQETEDDETLDLKTAKDYYSKLDKAN
jgi:hypothetical protein